MTVKPLIWALLGARVGDNAQVLEWARRVGGTVVEKQLSYGALHAVPNVLRGASLAGLTAEARALVKPPWPDLVIGAGRRSAPVSLAIRKLSGGQSRLVHIGRPRLSLNRFDLVITTPQYGLPPDANVVMLPTPLAVPRSMPQHIVEDWRARWAHLPRPWIMATIGASKYPLRLGPKELAGFADALTRTAAQQNASVILLDSPRSAATALADVAQRLQCPHWSDSTRPKGAYQAALALADRFAVTGDSVSMVTEMMQTGKPVAVHQLSRQPTLRWSGETGLGAVLARKGVLSPPRDVDHFMQRLLQDQAIGALGAGWGKGFAMSSAVDSTVDRIRALLRPASFR